jgi:hypothetical protein
MRAKAAAVWSSFAPGELPFMLFLPPGRRGAARPGGHCRRAVWC